jgi:hypothetical protein
MQTKQKFEEMSLADQHTVRLHMRLMIIRVRELATREARITAMVGNEFSGPHRTGVVIIDAEFAGLIADRLDAETVEQREVGLRHLAELRATLVRRGSA